MSAKEIVHYSAYERKLHIKFAKIRGMVKSFEAPSAENIILAVITFGIIFIINRYISYVNKSTTNAMKKEEVLSATTSRTIFNKIGLLTSNIFAFIIFPSFVFINVILIQWVMTGGKIYDGRMVNIGYLLHSSSGSFYFICGGLQFYTPLRQHYPMVHRFTGYTYYLMVLLTSIGIVWVSIKPHAGLSSQILVASMLPPWYLHDAKKVSVILKSLR